MGWRSPRAVDAGTEDGRAMQYRAMQYPGRNLTNEMQYAAATKSSTTQPMWTSSGLGVFSKVEEGSV